MKHLTNILGMTAPRRQQLPAAGAHQVSQDMPPAQLQQGERHMPTQVPPTRRPSREQMAPRGSQASQGPAARGQYPPTRTRSLPAQSDALPHQHYDHEFHEGHPYNYAPPTRPPYRQAPATPAGAMYEQHQHALPQRAPAYPTQTMPAPTRSSRTYRYTDDCDSPLPADVMGEWEAEIESDDLGSMEYGDWEQRGERNDLPYQQYERDFSPAHAHVDYSHVSHEMPIIDANNDENNFIQDMRNSRLPTAAQSAPHTNEQIHYRQRITQPLNPQIVAEMNRERAHPQEAFQTTRQTRVATSPVTTQEAFQTTRQTRVATSPVTTQEALQTTRQTRAATPPVTTKTSAVPAPAMLRGLCTKCKGAGYLRADVPYGHPNFGKPIRCECKEAEQREKRRQQLREMSNIHAFREQTFDTFNPRIPGVQEAYREAATYANDPKGWLLLVGPNGCGKTHLAAAIANRSLDGGAVVLLAVVPDLLDHLRAAFAPTANEVYDQLFAKMREAELLVLDDLGSQNSSSWANEKLFQLLNYRYNMGMPTVITTNGLSGTDERIRSRLSDASLVIKVHLNRANDHRPQRTSRRSY